MKKMKTKLYILLWLLFRLFVICLLAGLGEGTNGFVTLVNTEDYFLPARILLYSLQQKNTQHDMIVLISSHLSGSPSIPKLQQDSGCSSKVHLIFTEPFNRNWSSMFDKLKAWELAQYEKLVFIDSDCIAMKNIDFIFDDCPKDEFCVVENDPPRPSNLTSGEKYFNAGFFVFSPSPSQLKEMLNLVPTRTWIREWAFEQDFLNWFVNEKGIKVNWLDPDKFNRFNSSDLVHYLQGKPWYWWLYPVPAPFTPYNIRWGGRDPNNQWQNLRIAMPWSFVTTGIWGWPQLSQFLVIAVVLLLYGRCPMCPNLSMGPGIQLKLWVKLSVLYVLLLNLWIAFFLFQTHHTWLDTLIPPQQHPWVAWFTLNSWTITFVSLYLRLICNYIFRPLEFLYLFFIPLFLLKIIALVVDSVQDMSPLIYIIIVAIYFALIYFFVYQPHKQILLQKTLLPLLGIFNKKE